MPQAIPFIAAAFATAATSAASAVGISAMTAAGIGAAVGQGVMALTSLSTWTTMISLGSLAATMTAKVPKPPSAAVQLDTKLDPNPPRTVAFGRTAVAGSQLYQAVSGVKQTDDNIRLSRVIGLSVGPIDSLESTWVGDKQLTFSDPGLYSLGEVVNVSDTLPESKLWRTNFRQGYSLGQCPEPSAPPTYTGTYMPGLSAASKLSGIAHVTQHLDFLNENFPSGDPKGVGYKFVGKFVKLYDPRKDSTYPGGSGSHRLTDASTHEWSENPVIVALNFALGGFQNGKRVWGFGAPWETVDVASFIYAANIADANGWTTGGEFSTQDEPFHVLSTLLQTASAQPVNNSGHLSVFINAPTASLLTLTGADVVGNIEISASTAWRDRKNRALPFCRLESSGWEQVAGKAVTGASYLAEDGGEVKTFEVSYPYCQNVDQAHQLAAYDLVNTREMLQFTVTCSPRLTFGVRPGDALTVNIATIPELQTPGMAVNNQKCVVVSSEINPQTWEITLLLRSETDLKHPFALGQTSEAPSSPSLSGGYDPSLPYYPGAGSSPDWTIIGNSITKGGVIEPAVVIGGACSDANVREIIVDYREFGSADDAWTNHTTASTDATRFEITGLKSAQSYYAAVSYRTVLGVQSARLVMGPITTADLSIPAENVDFLTALGTSSIAEFGEFVQEAANAATQAANSVTTIIDDVNLLGETALEATVRDLNLKDRFDNLTHVDGIEVGTVVQDEITQRIEGQNALTTRLTLIGAETDDKNAFVLNLDTVKTSPTESLAQRLAAMTVEAGENADAKILDERVVWSNAIAAQANATTQLTARVGDTESAILSEQTARTSADTAFANDLSLLGVKNSNGTAWVLNQSTVEVTPGQSFASALASLNANTASNQASITTLANTVTTANSALSTRIDTVTATANGHTSSISTLSSASSTYGARWGVTLNTNGHISGLLLNNGGQNKSSMTVVADNFVIASSAGGALTAPFAVSGSTVYMDNVVARNIGAGTITASQIVGGAVTAASATEGNPGLGGTQNFGFSSTGGKHVINASCTVRQTGTGVSGVEAILYRNGSEISRGAVAFAGPFSSTIPLLALDQPGSGSHNYSVVCNTTGGSTGTNAVSSIKIVVTELKR